MHTPRGRSWLPVGLVLFALLGSACAAITKAARSSGLPVPEGSTSQPAAADQAASSATSQPANLPTLSVGHEGIAIRVKPQSWQAGCRESASPVAVVDITDDAPTWNIVVMPRSLGVMLSPESGQPALDQAGCFFSRDGHPHVPLKRGRYRVAVVADTNREQAYTLGIAPSETVDPLLKVSDALGDLPVEHRALQTMYPFLTNAKLEDAAVRRRVLEQAPKDLFVFPMKDLPRVDDLVSGGVVSSLYQDKKPTFQPPVANEPLLRLDPDRAGYEKGGGTYLGLEGTIYFLHPGKPFAVSPSGPVVLPQSPRFAWLGMETLLKKYSEDPEEKPTIEKFHKMVDNTETCMSNAVLRFDKATQNVLINEKQRAAAERRLDADRAACKPEAAVKERESLRERLLKKLSAERQKDYDAVKPRLERLFAAGS